MNKIKTGLLAFVLTVLMSFNVSAAEFTPNPDGAIPTDKAKVGQVYVIIEDVLESEDTSVPAPKGRLIGDFVDLYQGDSMFNVVIRAANQNEVELITADTGFGPYISSIGGVAENSRGAYTGWTFSLNDWFTHLAIGEYTTDTTFTSADGDLQDQDIVRAMFTLTWGDLGGSYNNNNKNLNSIEFSEGKLNKDFKTDDFEYELTLNKGTKKILVTPTIANKNFQCRIFVGEQEYRTSQFVDVKEGSNVKVICGDPEWPSMNNGEWGAGAEKVPATTYNFKIKYPKEEVVKEQPVVKEDEDVKEQTLPTTGQDLNMVLIVIAGLALSSGAYLVLRRN